MKKNKIEKNIIGTPSTEISKLIKVIVAVFAFFLMFLIITYFITKKNDTPKNEKTEATIQYDEIIVGQLLTRNETEYYVLVKGKKDAYDGLYESYLTYYKQKENALKTYTINLSNGFNSVYVSDNSNLNISNIDDIRFTGTTLLKIKDKKIEKYFESKDKIVEHFEELLK